MAKRTAKTKIKIDEILVTYNHKGKRTGGYRCMFDTETLNSHVLEDIEHDFAEAIQDAKRSKRKPEKWESWKFVNGEPVRVK